MTVEINNTDAEGRHALARVPASAGAAASVCALIRLVLGDGVAYAAKHLSPHTVIDMATLTGAQGTTDLPPPVARLPALD
jgi:probable aminopeptidase NPEPL1